MDVDFLLPSDPTEDLDGDREMYEWFLSQKSWRLPQPPFWVNEWTRVTGPLFYYLTEREAQSSLAYLKGEISKPNARHMTGALQLTIRRVRELQQEAFECAELANQLTLICQLAQQKSDRIHI